MGLSKASEGTTRPHDETDPGRPGTPMEISQDGHKRYLLPDPSGERDGLVPFTRASTVKGAIQDKSQLQKYDNRMLGKGLAISPDLVALVASTPLNQRGAHDVLDEAFEEARTRAGARAASNYGSALHAFTEQIDLGEPLEEVLERVPEPLRPDVRAYVDMLEREGLTPVPELVERVVVNLKLETGLNHDYTKSKRRDAAAGVAARFDRMYRWTDPADGVEYLVGGDLKTGKNAVAYGAPECAQQIAIAVNADYLWNEDEEAYEELPARMGAPSGIDEAWPRLRTDIGLLIHLPIGTGTCEAEELDLVRGWEEAQLAVRVLLARKGKNAYHRPFSLRRVEAEMAAAPAARETDAERADDSTPAPTETEVATAVGPHGEKWTTDAAKDGSPLQPVAGDGQRGCSVCGRRGHRRGSPKCWGDEDPDGELGARTRKRQEGEGLVPAPGPMTGRPSAGGPIAYVPPAEEATVPVPDGVIACGPDGAVAELTPEDAATVRAFAEHLENMAAGDKPCSHPAGYTRNEQDVWVCAKCGQESPQAAEARQAREAMADRTQADAERMAAEAAEPAIPDENRSTDEDQGPAQAELAETYAGLAEEAAAEPDPFAEPVKDPSAELMRMVQEADSREKLQVLRRTGLEGGIWTAEHTKAGIERLKELAK